VPPLPTAPPTATGDRWARRRAAAAPYLFLAPWLIGIVGLTLGPMLASLYLSFTDYNLLQTPTFVGFDNFERMFTSDPRFFSAVRVTVTYVFVSVPLQLAFALAVAVVLNRGLRGLPLYRSIYYIPSLVGTSVAVAILWRRMFGRSGLVNQVLALVGIEGGSWIGHPDTALWTLIILNVWTFGSPMVIFLAALRQIPASMYESAAVDGANRYRTFWHITIPLLTPVIFFNLVLQLIGAFQAFTPAFVVSGGSGGPASSTLFYTLYLYQQGFTNFNMGYASAMAWLLLAAIGLLTLLNFKLSKYWVFYGE
jgi:multiple sugar transport system permease protein